MKITWLEDCEPEFEVGKEVWVRRSAKDETGNAAFQKTIAFQKAIVMAYVATIAKEDFKNEDMVAVVSQYRLNVFNPEELGSCNFLAKDIYKSEEEARRLNELVEIKFSDKKWKEAIGLGPKSDRLDYDDEAELGSCCAAISEIRDALWLCCKNGGMTRQEIEGLQKLLDSHEVATKSMCPTLYKILDAIGVKWDKKE